MGDPEGDSSVRSAPLYHENHKNCIYSVVNLLDMKSLSPRKQCQITKTPKSEENHHRVVLKKSIPAKDSGHISL